jgi:hypothetical protein
MMAMPNRQVARRHRVAFVRCRGLRNKAEPIGDIIKRSTKDVTRPHVIASFLAWSDARGLDTLRFMNASVSKLLVKGDHSWTAGVQLGAKWVFNLKTRTQCL